MYRIKKLVALTSETYSWNVSSERVNASPHTEFRSKEDCLFLYFLTPRVVVNLHYLQSLNCFLLLFLWYFHIGEEKGYVPPAGYMPYLCQQRWKHCLWLFLRSSQPGSKSNYSYSSGALRACNTGWSQCVSVTASRLCPTLSIIFFPSFFNHVSLYSTWPPSATAAWWAAGLYLHSDNWRNFFQFKKVENELTKITILLDFRKCALLSKLKNY